MQKLGWKKLYYDALWGIARMCPAEYADALISRLGRLWIRLLPLQRANLCRAIQAANFRLDPKGVDLGVSKEGLAVHAARMLARDYLAEMDRDLERYSVTGLEHIEPLVASGRGAIVLGCHLGAYVPALHWMYRRHWPLRLLAQRPSHVSRFMQRQFEAGRGPLAQSGLFVRRDLSPGQAAERALRARAALREGMLVYVCGDVPTDSGREATFLGAPFRVQSMWVELAIAARVPVVPLFALFEPDARYQLHFDTPFAWNDLKTDNAIDDYVSRLERVVREHPQQAWPYWSWAPYQSAIAGTPDVTRTTDRREVWRNDVALETAKPLD